MERRICTRSPFFKAVKPLRYYSLMSAKDTSTGTGLAGPTGSGKSSPAPDKRPRDENGFRLRGKHNRAEQIKKLRSDPSVPVEIEDDAAEGAKYVVEGPLRRVTPYFYTYLTWCKERWRDRLLLDVFSSEFRLRDRDYYVCHDVRAFWPRQWH